jgi:hypothetical protein
VIATKDFQARVSNTLRGFVVLQLAPSGIVLHGCSYHEQGDRRWIGLPGKPQIDAEGRVRSDPETGKTLNVPVVEIVGREARERFQTAAVDRQVDRLLGTGEVPR